MACILEGHIFMGHGHLCRPPTDTTPKQSNKTDQGKGNENGDCQPTIFGLKVALKLMVPLISAS